MAPYSGQAPWRVLSIARLAALLAGKSLAATGGRFGTTR
jgi:hypothetical protein